MKVEYKTPPWSYGLVFGFCMLICAAPIYYFSKHPDEINILKKLYYLLPLILLFFFFLKKRPEAKTNSNNTAADTHKKQALLFCLLVIAVELFILLISFSTSHALAGFSNIDNLQTFFISSKQQSSYKSYYLWFCTWCYFILYTATHHQLLHTEKKIPLVNMAIYSCQNNLINAFLKRATTYFPLGFNLVCLYLSVAFLLLTCLYFYSGPINLGFDKRLFILLFIISIFSSIINLPTLSKHLVKLKLQGTYYFFFAFTTLVLAYLFFYHSKIVTQLLQYSAFLNIEPSTPTPTSAKTVDFFSCSLFVLFTPLCSSIIVKHGARYSTKHLVINLIALPIAGLLALTLLSTSINSHINIKTSTLIILACSLQLGFIFLFSRKKSTLGLLLGELSPPMKQRILLAGNNYYIFSSMILGPALMVFCYISFGKVNLINLSIIMAAISMGLTTIGVICMIGHLYRANKISRIYKKVNYS